MAQIFAQFLILFEMKERAPANEHDVGFNNVAALTGHAAPLFNNRRANDPVSVSRKIAGKLYNTRT